MVCLTNDPGFRDRKIINTMHCSLLVSLCVSLSVILISSVTGIGTPTTDLSSSEITKDPIPQYTILHAPSDLLDALEKIPNPNSYGRPLKQYSIHNAHNGVRRHRRHTVSQMTTAAAPTPTVLPIPGGGYVPFFQNQDGAISAADYMTYRIVKTIAGTCCFLFVLGKLTLEVLLTRMQSLLRLHFWMHLCELYVLSYLSRYFSLILSCSIPRCLRQGTFSFPLVKNHPFSTLLLER